VASGYIPDVPKSSTVLIWIIRVILVAVCVGLLTLLVVRDILPVI
jgi:hypothetical protein